MVSEIGERYRKRADAFEALIESTPRERWSSPSPCEGWVARDVVGHVVGFSAQVLRERAGVEVDVPAVSDDPVATFRAIRDAVQRVFDDPETPPEVVWYLDGALSFDLPQHWWDLATATGQDTTIDPEEVDVLWEALSALPQTWWTWHRDNGWYAAAGPVPDDAPLQDRVLGLIGRDPRWTPGGVCDG